LFEAADAGKNGKKHEVLVGADGSATKEETPLVVLEATAMLSQKKDAAGL
jgi:hypothetical protein